MVELVETGKLFAPQGKSYAQLRVG
ncbi:protein of unknown function [Micropruina glycogenica]|uniref:Uncharacterized protein n=1 Tax=Micropruina glycogenica TaxID=75385 RepID=A0A2N9JFW1_9ACTN|nr:protein of unknown function [Micropruina glycogenica]